MPVDPRRRQVGFLINDVARLLRTFVDQRARELGMTRAQWALLVRLQRSQGIKQSELADMLEIQPITLTRLVDRLCQSGMIERRACPDDRRAKRLYLTPAAGPLVERLNSIGEEVMTAVLAGIDGSAVEQMFSTLTLAKENLREAIQTRAARENGRSQHHG